MKVYSNIVSEDKTRKHQLEALNIIAEALSKSYGPFGSHTAIAKDISDFTTVTYTKDGHSIASAIQFKDPIERSVQDLIRELTRHVVKEVGDGTTSATMVCRNIFKELYENSEGAPVNIAKSLHDTIKKIQDKIMEKNRECTLNDIYNIALISTNGNEEISKIIANIYEKYGMEVFIDIGTSTTTDTLIKEYDGMTLESGFSDMCFVNDKKKNTAKIMHPKIYVFNDPIDTPEMLGYLDAIINNNILAPANPQTGTNMEVIPTVILAKKITPDSSSFLETVVKLMNMPQYSGVIPLLIVSDIYQEDLLEDIRMMCGAPLIKKYLDPEVQKIDQEKGLAPTPETIYDFCGTAECVEADQMRTKFINPSKMFNEDGTYSDEYNSILTFLENEIKRAVDDNDGIEVVGKLKRRYNSFKGAMIDLYVGGITTSDKENLKASVEDAVLNCRSAAKYGVGYGANFMPLQACNELLKDNKDDYMLNIIYNAYIDLATKLYSYDEDPKTTINKSIEIGCPKNIRSGEYDKTVLTSIRSDIAILDTIDKIMSLMYTCNQYLVQSPLHNVYVND